MDSEELSQTLQQIEQEWERITSAPTLPRSLMNVIEYGLGDKQRGEVYVTRLLRYLLDPAEPHGMEAQFLRAFLEGFDANSDFGEPHSDLSNVRVRDEVWIRMNNDSQSDPTDDAADEENSGPSGRVDIVIDRPGEWFILVELKFSAEENNLAGKGLSQTEFYKAGTHVGETAKSAYANGAHYLYLRKKDADDAAADAFMNWTWEDVVTGVLQPFITRAGPTIPHRTLVQLSELRDDIEKFTDMATDEPNTEEKVELYLDNYTLLNDLQQSFEKRWSEFTDQWHTRFAGTLDEFASTTDEVAEGILAVDLDTEDINDTWYLRAKHKDWQALYRDGWWKPEDKNTWKDSGLDGLPSKAAGDNTIRILYVHRMHDNRDTAIEDNTLIFTFRNAGANPEPFYTEFSDAVNEQEEEIRALLPDSANWIGNKSNQFELRCDIPTPDPDDESAPDDFFEAYVVAVRIAFVELVVSNPELTAILTEIYDDSLDKHMEKL